VCVCVCVCVCVRVCVCVCVCVIISYFSIIQISSLKDYLLTTVQLINEVLTIN